MTMQPQAQVRVMVWHMVMAEPGDLGGGPDVGDYFCVMESVFVRE